MRTPTPKTRQASLRHAESLAYLWSKWGQNDYVAASNFMQDMPAGWDGYQAVSTENGNTTTVFAEWLKTAQAMFNKYNSYSGMLKDEEKEGKWVLLENIKRDIQWWKENQASPSPTEQGLLALLETHDRRSAFHLGTELLSGWSNVWLDTGWLNEPGLLNDFTRRAVESSDVDSVRRLVLRHGVDVNLELWTQDHSDDSQWGFGSTYGKFKANQNSRRLGYFVCNAEMAKTLSNLGFDWKLKDSTGQITLTTLQSQSNDHFNSVDDRSDVMKYLNGLLAQSKSENPQEVVWDLLAKARKQEDVAIAVSGVKWQDLRGPEGENFMHAVACFAPTSFKKYATSKAGLALLSEKDSHGRLPLEWAVGLSDSEAIGKSVEGWVELRARNSLPALDWLETKWLSFENDIPNSLVAMPHTGNSYRPSLPASEWKQQSKKDFQDALTSARGQAFLEMAAQHYGAKLKASFKRWRSSSDNRLYLDEWVGGPGEFKFLEGATSKAEVHLALWESWNILVATATHYTSSPLDIKRLAERVEKLTEKALVLDIDVGQMKRDVLSEKRELSGQSGPKFNQLMKERFPGWDSLEARIERQLLTKRVAEKGVTTKPKFDGAL